MIERATAYVQEIVDHMDDEQIVAGIAFFEKIRDVVAMWESEPDESSRNRAIGRVRRR